ncbi:hypothetical protein [Propioniciclava flava]
MNEAALLITARRNQQWITKANLDEAIEPGDRRAAKRTRVMNERELLITAYHEGGHALGGRRNTTTIRCKKSRSCRAAGRWLRRW